jgi:uncharacterized lipoprotein NlpE involved in copper resistance
MKRLCIVLAAAFCFAACGNNSSSEPRGTDTANSVVLPANRSSDSLAVPGDSSKKSGTDTSMKK